MRLSSMPPARPSRPTPGRVGPLALPLTTLLTGLLTGLLAGLLVAVPAVPAQAGGTGQEWVVKAQRHLQDLGCEVGRADGVLDEQVRAAVIRLQSRHGRPQTGRLDQRTRRLLRTTDHRCDQRPVPRHTGHGRRIVVSQAQNWVWLVNGKEEKVAEGGMIDNTGVLGPGRYRTGSYCGRAARIHPNSDASGSLRLDHFVRFAPCGIGFHRVPVSYSTGAQIHPDWWLGTNRAESHGCLRLSARLARQVWDFTVRPTTVRVR